MTDNGAPLRIRPATANEAGDVRRIVEAAYGHYVPRMGKKPAPMLADYDELIGRGVVDVAVAAGDRVIGVIVLWPEPDHLYVDNIAVDPAIRGTGAGGALLAHADGVRGRRARCTRGCVRRGRGARWPHRRRRSRASCRARLSAAPVSFATLEQAQ